MSDTDSDVPEVGGELDILPYQFEPARKHVDRVTEGRYSSQSETDESDDGDDHARARDIRTDNIAWCDCECCTAMTTETECLCCQEIDLICTKTEEKGIMCITNHEGFIANCLNRDVLEVSLFEFVEHDGPIDDNEPINELYRYIAYRRFTRWIWHRLGKRNRKVIPACAVVKIRATFPSEEYCGFKYVRP